jgi:hypothetical protein
MLVRAGAVPENGIRSGGGTHGKKKTVAKENRYSDGTLATVGDCVLADDGELYLVIGFSDGILHLGQIMKRVPSDSRQKQDAGQVFDALLTRLSKANPPEPPKALAPEAVEDSPLFKGK